MTILPSKPSALIRVALKDLKACEKDKGYKIDMGWWHNPCADHCTVCMAGAVMAKSLDASPDSMHHPMDFDSADMHSLWSLNLFRTGYIGAALRHLNKKVVIGDRKIVLYEDDRKTFHKEMNSIATDLEGHGL